MNKMYTVPFGRLYEPYMDVPDDTPEPYHCACCGREILENQDIYYIADDEVYCDRPECKTEAVISIGERHLDEYAETYQP